MSSPFWLGAWVIAVVGLTASCDRATPSVATQAPPGDELQESSRALLARNCGECHTGDLDSALPRALRVFDLTDLDWSVRMTESQLRDAERRLGEDSAPTRGSDELHPIHVTPTERRFFHDYVESVIEKRNGRVAR